MDISVGGVRDIFHAWWPIFITLSYSVSLSSFSLWFECFGYPLSFGLIFSLLLIFFGLIFVWILLCFLLFIYIRLIGGWSICILVVEIVRCMVDIWFWLDLDGLLILILKNIRRFCVGIIFNFNLIGWFLSRIKVICAILLIRRRVFYTLTLVLRGPWLFISRIIDWVFFISIFLNSRLFLYLLLYFYGLVLLFFTKFPINNLSPNLLIKITDARFCCPLISILFTVFLRKISLNTSPQLRIISLIFIRIRTIIISFTVITLVKLSIRIIICSVWIIDWLILKIFLLFLFFQCFLHIKFST